VLAPVNFPSGGFPSLPNTKQWPTTVTTPMGTNIIEPYNTYLTFPGPTLGPHWEWNHNPDTTKFSLNNGLTLNTATVTNDLNTARNTLTHRILGPKSQATIKVDYSGMQDGDRAGLVLLRDSSAWVGLIKNGNSVTVGVWTGIQLTSGSNGWSTTSTGSLSTSTSVGSSGVIYLRCTADIRPTGSKQAQFSYSTDGNTFNNIGGAQTMGTAWQFFMGYRYGIFNFATKALGGKVLVEAFSMQTVN
jgi:beta-xylosidase